MAGAVAFRMWIQHLTALPNAIAGAMLFMAGVYNYIGPLFELQNLWLILSG